MGASELIMSVEVAWAMGDPCKSISTATESTALDMKKSPACFERGRFRFHHIDRSTIILHTTNLVITRRWLVASQLMLRVAFGVGGPCESPRMSTES